MLDFFFVFFFSFFSFSFDNNIYFCIEQCKYLHFSFQCIEACRQTPILPLVRWRNRRCHSMHPHRIDPILSNHRRHMVHDFWDRLFDKNEKYVFESVNKYKKISIIVRSFFPY